MADEQGQEKELELDDDMEFQHRQWFWQRLGWIVITLLLLAAVLGFFGSGLLDRTEAGERGSKFWLEYNRFGRLKAETSELQIHLGAGASTGGKARVRFSRDYMEGIEVMGMTPQPESIEAAPDYYTYVFNVPDGQQATIVINLEPERAGRLKGQVGLEGGPSVDFSQIIYP